MKLKKLSKKKLIKINSELENHINTLKLEIGLCDKSYESLMKEKDDLYEFISECKKHEIELVEKLEEYRKEIDHKDRLLKSLINS